MTPSAVGGPALIVTTVLALSLGAMAVEAWAPSEDETPAAASPATFEATYDGRYTFARIRFGGGGSELARFGGGREPAWAHDHPRADENFLEILNELTFIDTDRGSHRVLAMDDPELFRYPIAYIVEVGQWAPDQAELEALGAYLKKGGFLIVDDFVGRDINQIVAIFDYVLPGLRLMEIPDDHPIFDSFFRIEDPGALSHPYRGQIPVYLGLFEDNDPDGRMMAILNYNNDIAEYWEYSDRGFYPIDLANEAYKFGVNYVVYGMTR